MISLPLAGGGAACYLGELGDEELDARQCRFTDHFIEVLVGKHGPHHLGNGRTGCCYRHFWREIKNQVSLLVITGP